MLWQLLSYFSLLALAQSCPTVTVQGVQNTYVDLVEVNTNLTRGTSDVNASMMPPTVVFVYFFLQMRTIRFVSFAPKNGDVVVSFFFFSVYVSKD